MDYIRDINPQQKDRMYDAKELIASEVQDSEDFFPNCSVLLRCGDFEMPTIYRAGLLTLAERNLNYTGIKPRNHNQRVAMHLMNDKQVQAVLITGRPRSGKTFLGAAYSLEKVRSDQASKIVLSRPNIELGRSLGFLPGDKEDKFKPYLEPMYDCAENFGDRSLIDDYRQNGLIEPVPISFLKGRNFRDSIVFVDEVEDLTQKELGILGTRLDRGSKAILTGDIKQLSNCEVDGCSPLQTMLDLFQNSDLFAHIHFDESQGLEIVDLFYKLLD